MPEEGRKGNFQKQLKSTRFQHSTTTPQGKGRAHGLYTQYLNDLRMKNTCALHGVHYPRSLWAGRVP